MDLTSVLGIGIAAIIVFVSIMLGGPGALQAFIDIPSILIVFGGTATCSMAFFNLSDIVGVMGIVKKAFFMKNISPAGYVDIIVKFAEKARKEGMLALESMIEEVDDEFLKKGLRLAVDGTDPEAIQAILEIEISAMEERHKNGKALFDTAATMAPAFGMLGTLIGLILMLRNLEDPSKIGGGMAVALVTTFYGSLLANVFFLPIAGKLELRSKEEIAIRSMIIDGIMAIQAGDNPRIVEEKLKSYIAPKNRIVKE